MAFGYVGLADTKLATIPEPAMYPSKTAPERKADGAIHVVSLVGFALASFFLLRMAASHPDSRLIFAMAVYAGAVLLSISTSFAYHLLPRHDLRPLLRRWDHAAIYVVIAGTFSPLLVMAGTWSAFSILSLIWVLAATGIVFKLLASDMDPRWSLMSYLGLGALAFVALPDFWTHLPKTTTAAIAAGGLFYTIGTRVYRNKTRRYRYPIWHAWGTLGGACFCAGIWVALARQ